MGLGTCMGVPSRGMHSNHYFHVPYMHPHSPFPINSTPFLHSNPSHITSPNKKKKIYQLIIKLRMARVTNILALLAVAMLVADAYGYRTIITTVEVEEDNQGRQQKCSKVRAREEIPSCAEYLTQQQHRRPEVLQMRGIDNQRGSFDECCNELKSVDEQCRCDYLEEIARVEQTKGREQEGRQMLQKAKNLPSMCGIRPQRCDF